MSNIVNKGELSREMWRESIAPFALFSLVIIAWWAFYRYMPLASVTQSNHAVNVFDDTEFLFLIDVFVTLPLACILLIKDKKKAVIKGLALASLAIVVGSFLLPSDIQHWLPTLMNGRYAVLGVLVLIELATIIGVVTFIRTEFTHGTELDSAILKGITPFVPSGVLQQFIWFEGRMWACLFMPKKIATLPISGDIHFSYWKKDGALSNALGFIVIMAFELPIAHVLLHFIWSPFAANVVTGLSLLGLLFFISERNAMTLRPISLRLSDNKSPSMLIIRYGLSNPIEIPLTDVVSASHHNEYVKRASHLKRFNYAGVPNVKLVVKPKRSQITEYYLGVDDPQQLVNTVNRYT